MTKEEILKLAQECNLLGMRPHLDGIYSESLEEFAKLVAEKEREACAKMIEDSWMAFSRAPNSRLDITPFPELTYVAKAIRARGQE